MLCESTFQFFSQFFTFTYNCGFFPFKWNKEEQNFDNVQNIHWQLKLWKVNVTILLMKVVFLGMQDYYFRADLAKLIFVNFVFISNLHSLVNNILYYYVGNEFSLLYRWCTIFCSENKAKHLKLNRVYPLENDGLGGMMKAAAAGVFVWSIPIFIFSCDNPAAPPNFGNWVPPENFMNYPFLGPFLAFIEAYLMAFTWASNMIVVILVPNFMLLFKFWCTELNSDRPAEPLSTDDSELRHFDVSMKVYREMQILITQFNVCFSELVRALFALAFVNQASINYGTIKLYDDLPKVIWCACLYLSVCGAFNLVSMHNFLALSYEASGTVIQSWKKHNFFMVINTKRPIKYAYNIRKYKHLMVESCCMLKAKDGSFKIVRKADGIQWFDSLIDKTVNMLLWK